MSFLRRKQATDSDGLSSDRSPETKTSERVQMVYNFCKRCGLSRIDLLNKRDCGVVREEKVAMEPSKAPPWTLEDTR